MVKILRLSTLLCALSFICTTVFANLVTEPPTHFVTQMGECNAPPPDSFRVTSVGHNFVSLAWNPNALGDNHLITVFQKNASSTWDSLYSVYVSSSSTYTLTNMDQIREHRVEIRTVCNNGDPSKLFSGLFPPFGLILELVIGKETPVSPVKLDDCTTINYNSPLNKWIGFELSFNDGEGGNTITSLFEFEKVEEGQTEALIKRVDEDNASILIAANHAERWPTVSIPSVKVYNFQFEVGHRNTQGGYDGFGFLNVELGSSTVAICKELIDPEKPWNNQYIFTPMVANQAACPTCPGTGGSKDEERSTQVTTFRKLKPQNPFIDYLNIFLNESNIENNTYFIELIDVNNRVLLKEQFDIPGSHVSIPTANIMPGFYLLRIQHNSTIHNFKVIKPY
jgi:hypothetical protein